MSRGEAERGRTFATSVRWAETRSRKASAVSGGMPATLRLRLYLGKGEVGAGSERGAGLGRESVTVACVSVCV